MPVTDKDLANLKLTGVQQYALLLVGAQQTVRGGGRDWDVDRGGLRIAKVKREGPKKEWYWAGTHEYWSDNHQKNVTIRAKTFRALQKKGLLVLAGMVNVNNSLRAQVSAVGWEVFDILARRYQEKVDAREDRLLTLTKEEELRGSAYKVGVVVHRKVKVVRYKAVVVEVDVLASSKEQAQEKALELIAQENLDERTWTKDYNSPLVEAEASRYAEVVAEKQDPPQVGQRYSETPVRRAQRRLDEESGAPRPLFGIEQYVKGGERAPEYRKALVDGFGGRILDMDLDLDASEEDSIEAGADLDRFQFVMDED